MSAQGSSQRSKGTLVMAYANWVIRWRWAVLFLTLLAVAAAGSGGRFISFSTDYRVFFSKENPQLNAFEEIQDIYTKDDNILFVLKPRKGDVFRPEVLSAVRDLTEKSWQVPFSTRVDSITNFQHSFASGDDLTVEDLVPKTALITSEDLSRAREVSLSEPLLLNRLISPDASTTAVNVNLTLPQKSQDEVPRAMAFARGLADDFRTEHPDIQVAVTGVAALNQAFTEASLNDLGTLLPIMYGVLILTMIILLRSVSGTLATVAVIGLSAATAMGLAGWLGIQITPPSAVAPTIILTLAIADSVHILITMFQEMRRGAGKREALVESLRINFHPVFLTSLTTFIGFLSLNFSDAPPFRDLGNITAMGVVAAWAYSTFTLPALMSILPVRIKPRPAGKRAVMERLAEFVIARRRPLLWGMIASVIGLTVLIPRIQLNDQFINYFDRSITFRVDTDFAMENLSGIYTMQFSLGAGEAGGISEPDYQERVQAFTDWLREQPGVVHVQVLTDIMQRLNKNMHSDDPAFYRLPEERELAAQYLLLFEMSLPYGLDLNNQINVDKSAVRLIATLENVKTLDGRLLKTRAERWLVTNFPAAKGSEATSPFVMFSYISERNIKSMLIGTALAFFLISLSLTVALRNIRLGLFSLIPNIIPALMTFGVWAIFVGEIGVASSVVTASSLGIIVDDTVHFLSKYLRAQREQDASPQDAVRYAFSTVGTALWVTSVILIAGFGLLSFSAFEINESLGLMTATAIFMALVADLLLLPALLMAIDRKKEKAGDEPKGIAATA